jgi:hypothetical protein
MTADPEEVDSALRAEADGLLGSGLHDVLAGYGDVHVVGSYALHLMAWRDLDIEIIREPPDRRSFFELGYRLANHLMPPRLHYRDEVVARTPGLPIGLYWGIYLGDERAGAWKIDVWSVDRQHAESARAKMAGLQARLSPEIRRTIIELKSKIWADPGYRRTFSSQDLYDAVLEHGVRDLNTLWEFLRARRGTG